MILNCPIVHFIVYEDSHLKLISNTCSLLLKILVSSAFVLVKKKMPLTYTRLERLFTPRTD